MPRHGNDTAGFINAVINTKPRRQRCQHTREPQKCAADTNEEPANAGNPPECGDPASFHREWRAGRKEKEELARERDEAGAKGSSESKTE